MRKFIASGGVVALLSVGMLAVAAAPVQAASTLIVTTTVDENGPASDCTDANPATDCSVREALAAATSDGDVVQLQSAATYVLAHGQIDHGDTAVTVEGNGSSIDAGGTSRVFVQGTGTLTVNDLALTGTHAQSLVDENGGAIEAGGDVILTRSSIQGGDLVSDAATARGGAIYAAGDVTLVQSDIEAIQPKGLTNVLGGAVYSGGSVTLTDSNISAIQMDGGGLGGAVYAAGSVTATGATVENSGSGTFTVKGGGIYAGGPVVLSATTVSGNQGIQGGGVWSGTTVALTDGSVVSGNVVYWQSEPFGGGVYAAGDVSVTGSTVTENVSTWDVENGNLDAQAVLQGGGIWSGGTVTLDGAAITANQVAVNEGTSGGWGGGVYAKTGVSVTGSRIVGNSVFNGPPGGPAAECPGCGPSNGGGLFTDGTVTVTDSQITGNSSLMAVGSAADPKGGGGIQAGVVTLTRSTVADNQTTGFGGGVLGTDVVKSSGSTVSGNQALQQGGGVGGRDITLEAGTIIQGNTAASGGGVWATGSVTGSNVAVTGNEAISSGAQGGGVWAATASFTWAALTLNTAGPNGTGGGLYTTGTATLENTTVAGNSASTDPNQFPQGGSGGGVAAAAMIARFSTIADNAATTGANVAALTLDSAATVVAYPQVGANCAVASTGSAGYSYDDDGSCGFLSAHDVSGGRDPMLGPLADNGGATQTMHPLPGSPLVDAIPSGSCTGCVVTDQRGITRPQGRGYDIGAVEVIGVAVGPRFTG